MIDVRVVRGSASAEELAAVVAVLMAVCRDGEAPQADPGAASVARPAWGRHTAWSRGGRALGAPAGSWRAVA